MRVSVFIFCVCTLFAQGCLSDDGGPPPVVCNPIPVADQNEIIDAYIADNGLTMTTTATGLRYSIDIAGTGDNATYGDVIEVEYQGILLDGTVFDQGLLGPPSFPLFQEESFIPGFEEALLLMNEGAQATIIIPGELGYGCFPPTPSLIGDNEILVFELTMVSVNS